MSRIDRRLARIKEDLPIAQVLSDYGYNVSPHLGDREQQFSCNLHGNGLDSKPSARVYGHSQDWFCFCCNKTRDAVGTVQIRENLGFKEAIAFLERKYGLPSLPWEDDDAYVGTVRETSVSSQVEDLIQSTRSFIDTRKSFVADLEASTKDRSLPMEKAVFFWELLDALTYKVSEGVISDFTGKQTLEKLVSAYQKVLWSQSSK